MKIIKRDPKLKEKQLKEKEVKLKEDEIRQNFLDGLKENDLFQKYVVEGIIKRNLDFLTDLRNIKNADFKNLEEVGQLVLQTKAARATLERILSELI